MLSVRPILPDCHFYLVHIQQPVGDSANVLQQKMQQAAEKGDLELLNRLAGQMLKTSANPKVSRLEENHAKPQLHNAQNRRLRRLPNRFRPQLLNLRGRSASPMSN